MDREARFLGLALRGALSAAEARTLAALHAELGDAAIRRLAAVNRVEPMVADSLMRQRVTSAESTWQTSLQANQARVAHLIAAAAGVFARLDACQVRAAVVEGGGVMLGTGLPEGAFCASDFDLLVESGVQHQALVSDAFRMEGFAPVSRPGRYASVRTEYRKQTPQGELWLAAGSRPFDRAWVPLRVGDLSGVWLERRVRSRKSALWVLAPTDALAFVSVHTSLHSFVRAPGIRLHVDVDRLVRDCSIDWASYLEQVHLLGVRRRAWTSLSMAAELLGTPIPDEVLTDLAPPPRVRRGLERLVKEAGVLERGRPKLRGGDAVLLDLLVSDQAFGPWLQDVLLPPTGWLQERFGTGADGDSPWRLHLRRLASAALHWRPR